MVKQKHFITTKMKNALGIEVTRPNDILVIMRGIPGSGKSTAASKLVKEGVIHSTDDLIEATGDYLGYFAEIKRTNNWAKHGRMHSKNFKNAHASMIEGISPVVIDNTNIKAAEAKKYVMAALELGYADENIEFVEVGTAGLTAEALAERNTHGVPLETIERMIKSMNSVGNLTVERVVGAKDLYKNRPKVLYSAVVLDDASRSKLFTALGGIRSGFEGAQDYDLILRYLEKTQKIAHIPKVLYSWRKIPGSTSM